MKTKQLKEMRNETVEKLNEKIVSLKKAIVKEQMLGLGETKTNVKIAHAMKRDVAQLMTLITEKKSKN